MKRKEALALLRKHKPTLTQRFDVTGLKLVGSLARDEGSDECDVDLIVWFDGPTTSQRFFGVQEYLQRVLNRKVDLMTERGLRNGARPYVEEESIIV